MSSQQNGLVAGNSQNEAGGVSLRNRSTFPLSYSFFNTERFAEYMPFYVMEGVSGDRLPLHSRHELRTYTLKSPLMQSLLKKKDFFYVPMQAILPLNWEKFYTNPVIGEDVPEDCGTGVRGFWNKLWTLFRNSWDYLYNQLNTASQTSSDDALKVENFIRFLIFFEQIYSTGSLPETLGISSHAYLHVMRTGADDVTGRVTFDDLFDDCITSIFSDSLSSLAVTIGGKSYVVSRNYEAASFSTASEFVSVRRFLELLRDELAGFSVAGTNNIPSSVIDRLKVIMGIGSSLPTGVTRSYYFPSPFIAATDGSELVHLNLARLWAYQLVCAHFYSNDHVDFVYSAELFRQYVQQLATRSAPTSLYGYTGSFVVNGLSYLYDSCSAHVFNAVFSSFTASGIFGFNSSGAVAERPDDLNDAYAYFQALFSFRRSLRFMDYFSGSRTLPLAVGDTNVDASSGLVDVLDLSRQRMMARFLLAVNRSGRKFGAYMQELFGKVPKPDFHNPFYLAHTSDVVGMSENENTAEGQRAANAVTGNLRTNADRYAFMFEPDRDCVVLGISYYDIPRVYGNATERQNFFLDRFDMFNPYMQYIGDQAIYRAEIGTDVMSLLPFGYTNRHMEYKQRYNQCAGGFLNRSTQLGTWLFQGDRLYRHYFENLSPSFIRSFNDEFDQFYTSLTGYSLGTYFHFICRYDNRMDATRPMAYAPQID